MAAQTAAPATTAKPRSKAAVWLGVLGGATLANVLVWVLTDPVFGHALVADQGGTAMTVTVPWVIAGTLIPGALGLALAAFLRRFAKGRTIWLVLSILALLGSFNGPATGTTGATVAVLSLMHVVAGVAVIGGGLALTGKSDVRGA